MRKSHSTFDAMRCDIEDAWDITAQARLAHRALRAILQYNNMPWLNSRRCLRVVRSFGLEDNLNEDALSSPKNDSTTRSLLKHIQGTQSNEIRYSINNVTLSFVGAASLEIAHRKPDPMTTEDHLNDEFLALGRIAPQPTQLSSVYQKITRKCLQGYPGTGPDLAQKNLQTAVCKDGFVNQRACCMIWNF